MRAMRRLIARSRNAHHARSSVTPSMVTTSTPLVHADRWPADATHERRVHDHERAMPRRLRVLPRRHHRSCVVHPVLVRMVRTPANSALPLAVLHVSFNVRHEPFGYAPFVSHRHHFRSNCVLCAATRGNANCAAVPSSGRCSTTHTRLMQCVVQRCAIAYRYAAPNPSAALRTCVSAHSAHSQ